MKMPWNWKPSKRRMIKDEMWSLVETLRTCDPSSPEYEFALRRYTQLHELEIQDDKLRTYRWGRIVDILGTFGLAGIVLTYEYWTPTTSSWARNLTKPFGHNSNNLLDF